MAQPIKQLSSAGYQREYYSKNRLRLIEKVRSYQARPDVKEKRKEYMVWYARLKKYGVTRETFEAMLDRQGGMCAICVKRKAVAIDHCNLTGKVRGLLCQVCNVAISILDNPSLLVAAKRYKDVTG